jgi:general stress protein 26
MDNRADRDQGIEKIKTLIEKIEFAMLTTFDRDGSLRSRPMATQKTDFDGDLWFFTQADTPKIHEIEHDQHVNVSFASPEDQHYVSLSGRAQIVRDPQKINELWDPSLKAWFPEGPDDPNIALLKVNVEKGEYWDSPSSMVAHALGMEKAIATVTSYNPGENEKVDLK